MLHILCALRLGVAERHSGLHSLVSILNLCNPEIGQHAFSWVQDWVVLFLDVQAGGKDVVLNSSPFS